MDEMTQIGEILSSGAAASLGTEEEQEVLEVELSELLAESTSTASGSPQSRPPPVEVAGLPATPKATTTLPAAPSMKLKQTVESHHEDVSSAAVSVPQLA